MQLLGDHTEELGLVFISIVVGGANADQLKGDTARDGAQWPRCTYPQEEGQGTNWKLRGRRASLGQVFPYNYQETNSQYTAGTYTCTST